MNYLAKVLDPAGRLNSSRGFRTEYSAAKQAIKWSMYGATTYVMNGSIRAVYRGGVRINLESK